MVEVKFWWICYIKCFTVSDENFLMNNIESIVLRTIKTILLQYCNSIENVKNYTVTILE